MASASSSSARNLFSDSKSRINQRVQFTVQGLGSLCKNMVKSSKSSEILMQSAKHFSQQESHLESADLNLRKMQVLITHLGYQLESIDSNAKTFQDVREQFQSVQE